MRKNIDVSACLLTIGQLQYVIIILPVCAIVKGCSEYLQSSQPQARLDDVVVTISRCFRQVMKAFP